MIFKTDETEISLFRDGRAIIKGTNDENISQNHIRTDILEHKMNIMKIFDYHFSYKKRTYKLKIIKCI